jgi:hypothetical protein
MQDFRLFYNFIEDAYPHHPLDNDSIWKHEIPSIAHNVSMVNLTQELTQADGSSMTT